MKFFTVLLLFFGYITFSLSQTSSDSRAPIPVPYVDPKDFSGLWYEIARTPNSYEENCVAATVEYELVDENEYKVTNRCFEYEIGGDLRVYRGVAEPYNSSNMSQIKKTYYWIFSKEYRIIHLDDYKTAVMVDDEMENVWIMNREPFLKKEKLDSIILTLAKYMDTSKLIFTEQDKNGRYKWKN